MSFTEGRLRCVTNINDEGDIKGYEMFNVGGHVREGNHKVGLSGDFQIY